ncbi:hypothetical protein [Hydrogenophaga sp. OTU3427]|uniref:hypothetical protein n=1 Tax=Hydrogenophaga sp. OTU3427 TaxID=3043856 RepID=UPI00313BA873
MGKPVNTSCVAVCTNWAIALSASSCDVPCTAESRNKFSVIDSNQSVCRPATRRSDALELTPEAEKDGFSCIVKACSKALLLAAPSLTGSVDKLRSTMVKNAILDTD